MEHNNAELSADMESVARVLRISLDVMNDNQMNSFTMCDDESVIVRLAYLTEYPRDKFIEEILTITDGDTDTLSKTRDDLFECAKVNEKFPGGELVKRRRPHTDTSESLEYKLAKDCFTIYQFVQEGDIDMLYDVLNAKAKIANLSQPHCQPKTDKDVPLLDTVNELRDHLKNVKEEMDNMKLHYDSEISALRLELDQKKDTHNAKKEEMKQRNNRVEHEIRSDIALVKQQCHEISNEINLVKNWNGRFSDKYEVLFSKVQHTRDSIVKELNLMSSKSESHENRLVKLGENQSSVSRSLHDIVKDIEDIRYAQQTLKEPNDRAVSALKAEQKRTSVILKEITKDVDGLAIKMKSTETSVTSLRKQVSDMEKKFQQKRETTTYAAATRARLEGAVVDAPGPCRVREHPVSSKTPVLHRPRSSATSDDSADQQPPALQHPNNGSAADNVQTPSSVPERPATGTNTQSPELPRPTTSAKATATASVRVDLQQPASQYLHGDNRRTLIKDVPKPPTTESTPTQSQLDSTEGRPINVHITNPKPNQSFYNEQSSNSSGNKSAFSAFYVGNILPSISEDTIRTYFYQRSVPVKYLKILTSKRQTVSKGAKVVVPTTDSARIMKNFLPRDVYVRQWIDKPSNDNGWQNGRVFYRTH